MTDKQQIQNPYIRIQKAIERRNIDSLIKEFIKDKNIELIKEFLRQLIVAERVNYILHASYDNFYLKDILYSGHTGYVEYSLEELLEVAWADIPYFLDLENPERDWDTIVEQIREIAEEH